MTKKLYMASPLFTPKQRETIDQMTQVAEDAGFEVFSPLEASAPIWKGRPPAACTPEERREVVLMNYHGVRDCDLMLCYLGGWNPAQSVLDFLHDDDRIDSDELVGWREDEIRKLSPSIPDTGVACEIGAAFAYGTPMLAYLHDGEEDRNMNLMIESIADGTARGLKQLSDQLNTWQNLNTFLDLGALVAEAEDQSG